MIELGLSLLAHGPDVVSVLRPWLDQFAARHGVQIEANVFEWETAWLNWSRLHCMATGLMFPKWARHGLATSLP